MFERDTTGGKKHRRREETREHLCVEIDQVDEAGLYMYIVIEINTLE